jgi:hypothetical protein
MQSLADFSARNTMLNFDPYGRANNLGGVDGALQLREKRNLPKRDR